ncbi:MAG: T9SS type A sorting domain-containing protein [bacterium]|nr:T9SS type A sorting domain-containing protein [bacterium]
MKLVIITLLCGCLSSTLWAATLLPTGIGKTDNMLTMNGEDFQVKSIYLLAWLPGENPGIGEQPLQADYNEIMSNIKATGANTVTVLHALMPAAFYQQARAHGLKIIQGIWFTQDLVDFQNETLKSQIKADIKAMIDNFHNAGGVDYSEDIIFLNIGNELGEYGINTTNNAHPGTTSYTGNYISAPAGSNATECFLAEICDYAVTYEINTYGVRHYVSHSTWSQVSPALLDTGFLDMVSYNVYSYWPDWMLTYQGGSVTGTPYQGYIEDMKTYYAAKPFYISEFGYSTAPLKPDTACVSEQEQADGIKARWLDISTAKVPLAGGTVFNYQDEWWTQANTAAWPSVADEDEHAQDDREEWFGIVKIDGTSSSNYTVTKKPAYYAVEDMYTPAVSTGPTAAVSAGASFWAYPNPCSKSKDEAMTFANMSGKSKLQIYTLNGELVYSMDITTDHLIWNLRNYYNNKVAYGIYLAKVTAGDNIYWQKIAIKP